MACAVSTETGVNLTEPCSISDPTSGFPYNLQSLRKSGNGSFYIAQSVHKARTFRVRMEEMECTILLFPEQLVLTLESNCAWV